MIYYFIKLPDKIANLKTLLLGLMPLILWELFSLFYYGFLFPNSAYAKAFTGFPRGWRRVSSTGSGSTRSHPHGSDCSPSRMSQISLGRETGR